MRDAKTRQLVLERRVTRLEKRWMFQTFISLFIIWHIFGVVIWLLPSSSAIVTNCSGLVRPYMVATGTMQAWFMFSPNPDTRDVYVESRIKYADGSVRHWEFPRMAKLSYGERYQRERFRKFVENTHPDSSQAMWPVLARYAARVNATDPKNLPVSVTLVRHFRLIPPPGQPMPRFQAYDFFTTAITAEDLK